MDLSKVRAYVVHEFIGTKTRHTPRGPEVITMYRQRHYNCFGKNYWTTETFSEPGETILTGREVDVRSLKTIAMGCCPPALMKDFIMQEGGEMVERDPVLEAMKLHKRGYFGGGD